MFEVARSRRICCSRVASVRQNARRPSMIASLSDQPAGHLAHMRQPRRHEAHAGSAELKRQPEALTLADRDIDAEFARRRKQAQRERLGRSRNRERARAMRHFARSAPSGSITPNTLG